VSISTTIVGVGSKLPEKIVTNEMLEKIVDTSDKWIKKRTGISERRICTTEDSNTLAVDATIMALESAKVAANDVDIIIATTVSADYATPSIASFVQKEIGCENSVSFDIGAGCTGFIYALTAITAMMESLNLETGVIVSSEVLSGRIDWKDRATCVLFGDGAGAVVVKRTDKNRIKFPIINNIMDTNDVLYIKNKKNDNPWSEDLSNEDIGLYMKGNDVYAFATDAVEKTLKQLDEKMGDTKIDKIVPHQANSRIIRFAASNTDFDLDQFYFNVDKCANTSSATIPIALTEAHANGWLKKGDNVALVGFGAGLAYGGIVLEWGM